MLGLCYAKVLKVSTYNPKNEKGEKDKNKYNYIVTIFDTGLVDNDTSKDVDITRGDVTELFIKAEQEELVKKISKFNKYDYALLTFDLQGNFKELLAVQPIK